jgi:Kef-type K+ transport system membrane component KefB
LFSLFIAVSMSITAFPVLARIVADGGLTSTPLGHIAISCAAFDDVTAWCMLAAITAMARASRHGASLLGPAAMVACYVLSMFFPVRTVLRRLNERFNVALHLPVMLIFVFFSSYITESAGIHVLFGAFLAGVVWPRNGGVIKEIAWKVEPVAMAVLIPLFFSYTGIRTNVGQVSGRLWWYELAIIAVAVAGKAGGAFAGARMIGFSARDSLALGSLMNTRGLVGLVVLNVGMDLGILSQALFAMMVLMALATTLMAAPVLKRVLPPRIRASDTESLIGGRAIGDRA